MDAVSGVAFSPDGKLLATGGDDRTVHIWDVASTRRIHVLRGHTRHILDLAFDPDGERLASGAGFASRLSNQDTLGEIAIWDVLTLVVGSDWTKPAMVVIAGGGESSVSRNANDDTCIS